MKNEVELMTQAVNADTPEQIAGKVREIIRILGLLLEKLKGNLTWFGLLMNISTVIEAIQAIIKTIKAPPGNSNA